MGTKENSEMCATVNMSTPVGFCYELQHKCENTGTKAFKDTAVQKGFLHSTPYKDIQMVGATLEVSPKNSHDAVMEKDNLIKELIKENGDVRMKWKQEQKDHNILKEKFAHLDVQLSETRRMYEEKLNSSMGESEERLEEAAEAIEKLGVQYSFAVKTTKSFRKFSEELNEKLSETRRMYEEKLSEFEQEQQAHNILKEKFNKLSEKNCTPFVNYVTELEQEKVNLMDQIQTIQSSEEMLKGQLSETRRMYEEKLSSTGESEERLEEAAEAIEKLGVQYSFAVKTAKSFRKFSEQLNEKLSETRRMYEEKLSSTVADYEDRIKKAVEYTVQLEQEKIMQRGQIQRLRSTKELLSKELTESCRMYGVLLNKRKQEKQAHDILKEKFNAAKETCRMFEEKLNEQEQEKSSPDLRRPVPTEKDSMSEGKVKEEEQEKEQDEKPSEKRLRNIVLKPKKWFKKLTRPVPTEKDSMSEKKVKEEEQEKEQDEKLSKKRLRNIVLKPKKWFKKLRRSVPTEKDSMSEEKVKEEEQEKEQDEKPSEKDQGLSA